MFTCCTPEGNWCYKFTPVRQSVSASVCLSVSDAKLEQLALRIFLIFWIQLGDDKCRKVTKSVFWKKLSLTPFFGGKRGQKGVKKGSLNFFSKTALRILLIFGMKLRLYKGFILAEAVFWKKIKGVKWAKRGPPGHRFFFEKKSHFFYANWVILNTNKQWNFLIFSNP